MRVLLDECVDERLRLYLPGHAALKSIRPGGCIKIGGT